MTAERHLNLTDLTLRPSGEWSPPADGWTVVRVVEGVGYCLHAGRAQDLKPGHAFLCGPDLSVIVRASQLGLLKLEFFSVRPQFLNGLLTVAEQHQLENLSRHAAPPLLHFPAAETTAQKFTRLATQSPRAGGLSMRSALLQLWSAAIAGLLEKSPALMGNKLRERFRQCIGGMSELELATQTLADLAAKLHCSERHFSRLFREEFGIALRSRQTELRLQRACQLLADSEAKIINVALDSGYRHLGLFNSMFKRRFGMTPGEWRQQNVSAPPKKNFHRAVAVTGCIAGMIFGTNGLAQTNSSALPNHSSTNSAPKFTVEKYLVSGNTVLDPEKFGGIFTNIPASFGTNVTFDDIRAALGQLQMAYRERGFVTVSVSLPPQKLTNATVKVKVTEGRLSGIVVKGNRFYSTENVLRALPSLHTNMLLNSHVFQRELDTANANRDRQIYPVIAPGLEPGTSELTLKVKDRFPIHARVELNNTATPGTPDNRVAFSAQYGNLWQLEHQVGVSYAFTPLNYGTANTYYFSPFDLPLIANYSIYYRLPLGRSSSIQQQIDSSNGHFGFNEVTHQFQMPPPTGHPDLTFYASRSTSDTAIQFGPPGVVLGATPDGNPTNLVALGHRTAGENVTLNEDIGFKFSLPLPRLKNLSSTLTFGGDYKRYRSEAANADIFYELITTTNSGGALKFGNVLYSPQPTVRQLAADYFPLSAGISGSRPDKSGLTTFNVQANYNIATVGSLSQIAYSAGRAFFVTNSTGAIIGTNANNSAKDNYFTLTAGLSREQRLYKDWTVLLHADGQWADTPLMSNEQFGMGGTAGVRGYSDGENYGDTGWRAMIEPRTPLINIGMVDGDIPFWVRASIFMDYGETYLLQKISGISDTARFWGFGSSLTANIGSHMDGRLTIAFPLMASASTRAWDVHVYFGVGTQF